MPERFPGGLFVLSPNVDRYLVGVLAETAHHATVLGLATDLAAGHRGIIDAIATVIGPIATVRWSGELYLQNNGTHCLPGVLSAVNDTSGYLQELSRLLTSPPFEVDDNSNGHVVDFLRCEQPFGVSDDIDAQVYAAEREHLFVDFNGLRVGGDTNFRHGMARYLQGARQPVVFLNRGQSEAAQRLLISRRDDVEKTLALCQILSATTPFHALALSILTRDLARLLDGEVLRREDAAALAGAYDSLSAYYREQVLADTGNEYDLIVAST